MKIICKLLSDANKFKNIKKLKSDQIKLKNFAGSSCKINTDLYAKIIIITQWVLPRLYFESGVIVDREIFKKLWV
jgi:hypothetical protein